MAAQEEEHMKSPAIDPAGIFRCAPVRTLFVLSLASLCTCSGQHGHCDERLPQ